MSRILKSSRIILKDDEAYKVGNHFQTDIPEVTLMQEEHQRDEGTAERASKMITKAGIEANEITTNAKKHAEEIISKAKIQSEEDAKKTIEEAKAQGYAEGREQGVAEADALKAEAQKLYDKAQTEREETIKNIEPDMVALVMKVVKKLTGDIAVIKPELVVNLIKQGLADATLTGSINIRVSKQDYDAVLAAKDEILSFAEGANGLDILKDLSLNKSDCIIETPFGIIDTSLDGQYSALKDDLYLALSRSAE